MFYESNRCFILAHSISNSRGILGRRTFWAKKWRGLGNVRFPECLLRHSLPLSQSKTSSCSFLHSSHATGWSGVWRCIGDLSKPIEAGSQRSTNCAVAGGFLATGLIFLSVFRLPMTSWAALSTCNHLYSPASMVAKGDPWDLILCYGLRAGQQIPGTDPDFQQVQLLSNIYSRVYHARILAFC